MLTFLKAVSLRRIDCFFSYLKLHWSDYMNDIFKDMQEKIGCEYIFDLPSYKRQVWHETRWLNLARYSKKQLENFQSICLVRLINEHQQIKNIFS